MQSKHFDNQALIKDAKKRKQQWDNNDKMHPMSALAALVAVLLYAGVVDAIIGMIDVTI